MRNRAGGGHPSSHCLSHCQIVARCYFEEEEKKKKKTLFLPTLPWLLFTEVLFRFSAERFRMIHSTRWEDNSIRTLLLTLVHPSQPGVLFLFVALHECPSALCLRWMNPFECVCVCSVKSLPLIPVFVCQSWEGEFFTNGGRILRRYSRNKLNVHPDLFGEQDSFSSASTGDLVNGRPMPR